MTAGTPDFGSTPEQAEHAIGSWARHLRDKARRATETRQRVEAVQVTESSPRGEVTITVDSQGIPTRVRFSDRSRLSGAELSALFMTVLREAQSKLAAQVETALGDQDPSTRDTVLGEYRQRFPAMPPPMAPQAPAPPAPERPTPPPDTRPPDAPAPGGHDDGDFSDETFLR